jgi:agmatine deiminase
MITRRSFLIQSIGAFGMSIPQFTRAQSPTLWVPPEDHPHEATFMQWPVDPAVYTDRYHLKQVQRTIATIANTISAFEPVIMLADAAFHASARKLLSDQVALWNIPTNDLWCRDSGPIIAFDDTDQRVVSHIQFNGWGNKQPHNHDAQIAKRVAAALDFNAISSGLVGEAGGVETNGAGTLIAHESSWINDNRNPTLSKDQISKRLLAAYGADQIIWSKGVAGLDITDYHIDSLARFVAPEHVVANLPAQLNTYDPFHSTAVETIATLRVRGVTVDVIEEPTKPRVRDLDFVASYVNHYICNGAIIMAEFGDTDSDQRAAAYMGAAYPDHEVIQINVDALGELGGGIHCATQQLPAQGN